MGSFGEKLKGFIFEDSPLPKGELSQIVPAVSPSRVSEVIPQVQNSPAEPIENSAAYKALTDIVFSKDTGFSRLLKSVKPLESVIPDESQRLRAALAILNGNGLSTEEIVRAIAIHDNILKSEKSDEPQPF